MASFGYGYGDYRDRDGSGFGSGVDNIQFPPPFPPVPSEQDLTPPEEAHPPPMSATMSSLEDFFGSMERFGRFVVTLSRIGVVHCLGYPYIVFSRQCQVYPYNPLLPSLLAPFSTTVVLSHITSTQGFYSLWRGWRTNMKLTLAKPLVEAMLLHIAASKNVLLAIIQAPIMFCLWCLYPFRTFFKMTNEKDSEEKTLAEKSLPRRLTGYIFVKGVLQASFLPFVSYSITEMVQHTTGRVLDTQSNFIFNRPLYTMDKYRRVPYLHLLGPFFLHEVATDAITTLSSSFISRRQHPATDIASTAMNSLWSSYLTSLASETLLYPLETVLVRLYCQGMPGLVDNVQTGRDVMFISTYYSGVLDCVREIWTSEGPWGFYKGFSSLVLRYAVHGALLLVLWRLIVLVRKRTSSNSQ